MEAVLVSQLRSELHSTQRNMEHQKIVVSNLITKVENEKAKLRDIEREIKEARQEKKRKVISSLSSKKRERESYILKLEQEESFNYNKMISYATEGSLLKGKLRLLGYHV